MPPVAAMLPAVSEARRRRVEVVDVAARGDELAVLVDDEDDLGVRVLDQAIHDRLDLIELLLVHHHLGVDHRSLRTSPCRCAPARSVTSRTACPGGSPREGHHTSSESRFYPKRIRQSRGSEPPSVAGCFSSRPRQSRLAFPRSLRSPSRTFRGAFRVGAEGAAVRRSGLVRLRSGLLPRVTLRRQGETLEALELLRQVFLVCRRRALESSSRRPAPSIRSTGAGDERTALRAS